MAYSKQTWDTTSYVNPTRMNHIEQGIADNAFESGSNSNGSWIKFADGTMICRKSQTFSNVSVSTAWGQIYESDLIDLGSLPQTFYGSDVTITASVINGNAWLEAVPFNGGATLGTTRIVRPTTATITVSIQIIAIGRWKA